MALHSNLVIVVDIDPSGPGTYPAGRTEEIPPPEEVWRNALLSLQVVREHWQGKAVITAHTSPLYRHDFLAGEYLDLYREFMAAGAEIAVHPHEDADGGETLYFDAGHMDRVISESYRMLNAAGITATAFRSSFFAFAPHLPPILERLDLKVSFSSAPSLRDKEVGATWSPQWGNDFLTARFLCRENYHHGKCDHPTFDVLEIPLGWDGQGSKREFNYLFNERATVESLCQVWQAITERGRQEGREQTVCLLCHGHGIGRDHYREQVIRFVDHVREQRGRILTATEARRRQE